MEYILMGGIVFILTVIASSYIFYNLGYEKGQQYQLENDDELNTLYDESYSWMCRALEAEEQVKYWIQEYHELSNNIRNLHKLN